MNFKTLTHTLTVPVITKKEKSKALVAKKNPIARPDNAVGPISDKEVNSKPESSRQKTSSYNLAKSFAEKSSNINKEKPKTLSLETQLNPSVSPVKDGKRVRRPVSAYLDALESANIKVKQDPSDYNPEIDRLLDESMKLRGETNYAPISHERQRKAKEALKSKK